MTSPDAVDVPAPTTADVDPGRTSALETKRKRGAVRNFVEWVVIIVAALLVAFALKTWVLQAFYIPSPSMERTLLINDRVLVNKLSYRTGDIERGDVVVFERPPEAGEDPQIKDLIKRVIALPGETVESRDGKVLIDGRPIDEPYLAPGSVTEGIDRYEVPAGHYWVMGDNRGNSRDSRVFKAIDEDLVIGRAFVRIWPLRSFTTL